MKEIGLFIQGEWIKTGKLIPVTNKFTGGVIAQVHEAGQREVDQAVQAARRAFKQNALTPYQRYEILLKASQITEKRKKDIAEVMAVESGITLKDAYGEIARAVQTFILSAEESKRITGEVLPVKANPGMENRLAFTIQVPVGVVGAITPFNAPFNNVIHKVAPAIAAGNAVVLKPSTATPQSALEVLSILLDAGNPKELIQVIFGEIETGEAMLTHPGINFYTFTGSTRVGEVVKTKTGLRRVALELGNNSATIVCEDANLDVAVPIMVRAAFRKAGQVCVSLQRVYAHQSIAKELANRLAREVEKFKVGNPLDPDTDIGPMISLKKAIEVEQWVNEAVSTGAKVLTGGKREGVIYYPTVLTNAKQEMRIVCEEVFGPVLSVVPYKDFSQAIDLVNDSPYGLQAGIFTNDINKAMIAAEKIEVGGLNINDTSNTRFDAMPYGGVKFSGIGREGPKYAIAEMTETKIIQMNILR
ncbi:aldehyde dehydrogenase family protein [Ammoniphilus resinae]|uniref:Acyl-CoA reductase-like NAD-dependent aldehyde dehydrogenase n=1 Tax=Ammoniphilus resinae TaxID=861532 RepID=A0ABS4GXG0_9BACL|nr:aldehyde dehydrogenase family protein [Ammoniphilus resinae]MBP1934555.1 acyl-CoA reductase-like NAD-dependent aldehyde dehydrogenase [Ammoniphilus resinae]